MCICILLCFFCFLPNYTPSVRSYCNHNYFSFHFSFHFSGCTDGCINTWNWTWLKRFPHHPIFKNYLQVVSLIWMAVNIWDIKSVLDSGEKGGVSKWGFKSSSLQIDILRFFLWQYDRIKFMQTFFYLKTDFTYGELF